MASHGANVSPRHHPICDTLWRQENRLRGQNQDNGLVTHWLYPLHHSDPAVMVVMTHLSGVPNG